MASIDQSRAGCSSSEDLHSPSSKLTKLSTCNESDTINKPYGAVCFCCLATNVPLILAEECRHNSFVEEHLATTSSLLICCMCHHMLMKIETFKEQISMNLSALKDPLQSKCKLVNNITKKSSVSIISLESSHSLTGSHTPIKIEPCVKLEGQPQPNLRVSKNWVSTDSTESKLDRSKLTSLTSNVSSNTSKGRPSKKPLNVPKNTTEVPKYKVLKLTPIAKDKIPLDISNRLENLSNVNKLTKINVGATRMQTRAQMKEYSKSQTKGKGFTSEKTVEPEKIVIEVDPSKAANKSAGLGKIGGIVLSEEEFFKEREAEKCSESYTKYPLKCESCIESFKLAYNLNKHNKRYHEKKREDSVECKYCKKYVAESSIKTHTHDHLRRYICLLCNVRSKSMEAVEEHFSTVHENRPLVKPKIKCKDCDYTTDCMKTYYRHRKRNHHAKKCKLCNEVFIGLPAFDVHMIENHRSSLRSYECPKCWEVFINFRALYRHKREAHPVEPNESNQPPIYYCKECDKFLTCKFTYKAHFKYSRRHLGNKEAKFECDYCQKRFPNKNLITSHIQIIHSTKDYKCDQCDKVLRHERALKNHIYTVHVMQGQTKKHFCHFCGKACSTKTLLKNHLRVHTGERPFPCEVCGMTFRQTSTLQTHKWLKHKILRKMALEKLKASGESQDGTVKPSGCENELSMEVVDMDQTDIGLEYVL